MQQLSGSKANNGLVELMNVVALRRVTVDALFTVSPH
jgi:hypothetical protein